MKPRIFIGSSSEGKQIAYHLQRLLDDIAEVTIWDQGVFDPSKYPIESLSNEISKSDFSVFIFYPDDYLTIRGVRKDAIRDNIIFEFGLAMGYLGRDRTIIVLPKKNKNIAIPTDLLGLTYLLYDSERSDGRISAALGPVALSITELISKYGARYMNIYDGDIFSQVQKQNRQFYETTVQQLITDISLFSDQYLLSIFDIDNFYGMNIVYGVEICNQIIGAISRILKERCDRFYRIGGDKFAVIIKSKKRDALPITKLQRNIHEFHWDKIRLELYVTCSIGFSVILKSENPEQIIIRAMQGLKIAKKKGKGTVYEGPQFVNAKFEIRDFGES